MSAETTANAAMQILLASGEARALVTKAMETLAEFDFDASSAYLKKAQHALREAHRVHTDVIQAEARGDDVQVPALFSHAQDTMMTTDSELRTVKRLVPVFRALVGRISALEHGTSPGSLGAGRPTGEHVQEAQA